MKHLEGKKRTGLIALLSFGVMGVIFLAATRAATPTASVEPESGSRSANTSLVADSSASGSSAVKFGTSGAQTPTCNLNATTANFASQVTAATAGQVICLAAGNYGTWAGTNKAITVTRQVGVAQSSVTMGLSFGSGDANFTVDGVTVSGGLAMSGSANHLTIRNSRFTSSATLNLSGSSGGILLDGNDHGGFGEPDNVCSSTPALIAIWGTNAVGDVVVSNSEFHDTNLDGLRPASENGVTMLNNEFYNIEELNESDCHHTDAIQLYGGTHNVIRGNYFHNNSDGIVAYDGTEYNIIEYNVVDLVTGRFGIELYSDTGSVVRGNTIVKRSSCAFNGYCGQIMLDHKSADPAGTGTVLENNVAMGGIEISNGSTAAVNRNNMVPSGASGLNFNGTPVFVGGMGATTWAGYKLAAGSPGINGAVDGGTVGIR